MTIDVQEERKVKRAQPLAVAFVLFLLGAAAAYGATMYARSSAVVRSERKLGAEVVARLRQGDAVETLGQQGRYYKVLVDGKTGWIYFNKLADDKPEDVASLLGSGAGAGAIDLTELEAGGALRGLTPMAENYIKASQLPQWVVKALESMQSLKIEQRDLEEFQREGRLGEYGEGM